MNKISLLKNRKANETGFSMTQIIVFVLLIAFLGFMFFFMKSNHDKANSIMDLFRNGFR